MNKRALYWLCQFSGWFGMVAIETINYTFFIVGKFSSTVLWSLISYAIIGIVCTHIFRIILKKYDFFKRQIVSIWLMASLSTLLLSSIIAVANMVPSFIENYVLFLKNITFIEIVGTIINWMRYVGVWVIIYFMYKTVQQNNSIQQEKLTLENLAKTTELELLKTQLNPHFLFNALNSIKALVIINPEQSRDAIVKLSELLRFTLQYGKERLIPINNEMTEVKKYLELEQLRFGNRLLVEYNIAENTLSQAIPPAIILTLAENAVKHGVTKQTFDSFIKIEISLADNFLLVQVINTGNYQLQDNNGIGLKHIAKRLEEVYHHQAVFSIMQQGKNVIATIKAPLSWQ